MLDEKFELQVKAHFDAAHAIRGYDGVCQNLHGHTWAVEVYVEIGNLDTINMSVDFAVVKRLMSRLLREVDHKFLNDEFHEDNLTAEFLAKWFFDGLVARIEASHTPPIDLALNSALSRGLRLNAVCIWESPECGARYCRPY